jgi:lipopolysaccharide transport protein LptA
MNRIQTCKSSFHLSIALVVVFCAAVSAAQEEDLRLPISLDADSTDYDGKSSMLMFSGLRLTQGSIGVQADEGRASKLDFEDSVWRFNGNVIFDVENGHIECDTADLSFSGHQLRTAIITGSPATFEMRRPNSEEMTYAEAGRLEYDFDTGIVTFSENATITEGGNQISSTYLVYDITEQRINARSGGDGDPKVRITYTPGAIDPIVPDIDAEEEIRNQLSPQDDSSDESGDEVP